MKKFAFLAACAIAFAGCSDDGMSLDDFCAAVVGCQSSGFTSADDCKMKIRSRAAQYPDCTQQYTDYEVCQGNLACGLGGVTSCTEQRVLWEGCQKGNL